MSETTVAVLFVLGLLNHSSAQGFVVDDLFGLSLGFMAPLVGLLITRKHPRNPGGWVLLLAGLSGGFSAAAHEWVTYTTTVSPGSLPGRAMVTWIGSWIWVPAAGAIPFLLLLFPHGELPSRRWRPALWLAIAAVAIQLLGGFALWPLRNDVALVGDGRVPTDLPSLTRFAMATFPLVMLAVVLSVISLIFRWRGASTDERQQIKWFLYGAGITGLSFLLTNVVPGHPFAYALLQTFTVFLVCAGIGAGVLRYRLYDIDRIISRTVAYLLVTGLLAALYTGFVLLVSVVSPLPTTSPLVVAVSTLAVAGLFRPLRTQVQSVIDRRFNRAAYDAQKTLEGFAHRLQNEIEVESLRTDLMDVVMATMEPAAMTLWVRDLTMQDGNT